MKTKKTQKETTNKDDTKLNFEEFNRIVNKIIEYNKKIEEEQQREAEEYKKAVDEFIESQFHIREKNGE